MAFYNELAAIVFNTNAWGNAILHSLASGPITSWEIDGETVSDFIFLGAPKSVQMVIAAMKLKNAYSLEGKLWPT